MARERRPDPDTADVDTGAAATATAEAPRTRRGTRTTPGSPLGRPTVEPMVEQVGEGEDVTDVDRPDVDYLNDREWLFDQVAHAIGCPMREAPYASEDGEPARGQRMDMHDATEPRTTENPMPRTYRIIACLDCGRRARIKLPRDDD